ncbi:MAG: mannose-1-phosphate guanylyltransferase [Chitinispirillaceae bacterium]|nr:mannose-1-phosphate guanylyltransferase [Chitinispirillaceae bacterium]
MVTVPVILAGGIGERFWQMSRSSSPKQLLQLVSSKTMVEETLTRVSPLCSRSVKPLIITGRNIARRMKKLLPSPMDFNCIVEPVGKNTAPAILLAAAWIEKRYGPAVMVVLSADHDIRPRSAFLSAVRTAVRFARSHEALVIFGVQPVRPESGYGYLHIGDAVASNRNSTVYRVKKFIEKPSREKARNFTKKKSYLWNSGMFVWRTSVILREFEALLPELAGTISEPVERNFSQNSINRFYGKSSNISIDYGIMERSERVYAVVGDFLWDDIGSWEAIGRIHGNNASGVTIVGNNILEFECKNSIIFNHSPATVAAIGLDDTAVVVTDDALLVACRSKLPDLKKYLALIKKKKNLPKELF